MDQTQIDRLAELAGECRHEYERATIRKPYISPSTLKPTELRGWKCSKCGYYRYDWEGENLPVVGSGNWQPTLEGLFGIIDRQDWFVMVERDDGSCVVEVSMWKNDVIVRFPAFGCLEEALSKAILKAAGGAGVSERNPYQPEAYR